MSEYVNKGDTEEVGNCLRVSRYWAEEFQLHSVNTQVCILYVGNV